MKCQINSAKTIFQKQLYSNKFRSRQHWCRWHRRICSWPKDGLYRRISGAWGWLFVAQLTFPFDFTLYCVLPLFKVSEQILLLLMGKEMCTFVKTVGWKIVCRNATLLTAWESMERRVHISKHMIQTYFQGCVPSTIWGHPVYYTSFTFLSFPPNVSLSSSGLLLTSVQFYLCYHWFWVTSLTLFDLVLVT
jgi:hypothetical protein